MGANLVVRFLFDLWNIFDTIVVVVRVRVRESPPARARAYSIAH
jgi:hypothetical protein